MTTNVSYELHVERDSNDIKSVWLLGRDDDGQLRHIDSSTFGPFDTNVDVSRWVWRVLALDLHQSKV